MTSHARESDQTTCLGIPAAFGGPSRPQGLSLEGCSGRAVGLESRDIQFGALGETPALHVSLPGTQDSAAARMHVLFETAAEHCGHGA